jgi:hypothetical protein
VECFTSVLWCTDGSISIEKASQYKKDFVTYKNHRGFKGKGDIEVPSGRCTE